MCDHGHLIPPAPPHLAPLISWDSVNRLAAAVGISVATILLEGAHTFYLRVWNRRFKGSYWGNNQERRRNCFTTVLKLHPSHWDKTVLLYKPVLTAATGCSNHMTSCSGFKDGSGRIRVVGDVMSCSLVDIYQCFGRICCRLLQVYLSPWRCGRSVRPKRLVNIDQITRRQVGESVNHRSPYRLARPVIEFSYF
jgi:hypothetical protein